MVYELGKSKMKIANHEDCAPEDRGFWGNLDLLLGSSRLVIDRPAGSAHPRHPNFIYPLDYGFLEGTVAADGGGIDVWVGSLEERRLVGVICTVDVAKRDAEVKLLVGCTAAEVETVLASHNVGEQGGIFIERK